MNERFFNNIVSSTLQLSQLGRKFNGNVYTETHTYTHLYISKAYLRNFERFTDPDRNHTYMQADTHHTHIYTHKYIYRYMFPQPGCKSHSASSTSSVYSSFYHFTELL